MLVRIDSRAAIKGMQIADVIENVRAIRRPYAEIDFDDVGGEARGIYDDQLRLAIIDGVRPPGSTTAVLGWIEFSTDGRGTRSLFPWQPRGR